MASYQPIVVSNDAKFAPTDEPSPRSGKTNQPGAQRKRAREFGRRPRNLDTMVSIGRAKILNTSSPPGAAALASNDLKSQVVDFVKDPSVVREKRFLLQGSLTRSITNLQASSRQLLSWPNSQLSCIGLKPVLRTFCEARERTSHSYDCRPTRRPLLWPWRRGRLCDDRFP